METEIEQKETEPTPEPEVKTPTPEEIKAEYEARIELLTKERDERDKGLKTAHSQLTKKDQELKSQADINTRLDGMDETQRILAAMIAEGGRGTGEEIEPEKRGDYLAKFDEIAKRNKEERDNALRQTQQSEYVQRAQAIYEKANEAFPDDDGRLLRVERFLDKGMPDEAEKIIAKAVEKKTTDTKEEKTVESEENRFKERLAEEKRKWMEETGQLVSETGGPSGASMDDDKWYAEEYGKGKSDDHVRAKKIQDKMLQTS